MRNCKDSILYAAAKQVRISTSENIEAYIYSLTEPAIEKSRNISFGPFRMTFPGIKKMFLKSNLKLEENHWCHVYDFDYDYEVGNVN